MLTMQPKNYREELLETGTLKDPTGKEIARLTLNKLYLVIDPYAFYEMIARYARKHNMRTPYQWIYQTFGKSGKKFPDREVKSLLQDMERRGYLYFGSKYVIPLVYYPLPEDAYPPYTTYKEVVAGLEPITEND